MPGAAQPDRIGTVLDGRYRIIEAMAAGSMGVVYRAERVPLGKAVAIKFLHAAVAAEPEFLVRFERETRALAKLSHPHCVSVVDFGVEDGAPYLVMDYVAGTTLRAILDDGPLVPGRAARLVKQLLAGLAHAHAQGLIHRDVKPANLIVTDEVGAGEHLRIVDFGLARLRGGGDGDATQTNTIVGTPTYMAPEQAMAQVVDARADLYAAGVVLYELVVGAPPFRADSTHELLLMHRSTPVPRLADHLAAGVELPPGLEAVIDRAMAKDPRERYQTALEMSEALGAVASRRTRTTGPRPLASRRTASGRLPTVPLPGPRWGRLAIVAAVVVAGGIAVGWAIGQQRRGVATPDAAVTIATRAPPDAGATTAIADAAPPQDAAAPDDLAVIELDPITADDPDPGAGNAAADDEAADAPATEAAVAPPPPTQATTIPAAIQLIKDGHRELALASLRALARRNPQSGYLPFLIGNLYFDQAWWSVALDYYALTIKRNPRYRENPVLIRNVIRTLAAPKTRGRAAGFLRQTIGHPALPYLKGAAAHDRSAAVRAQAAALVKQVQ